MTEWECSNLYDSLLRARPLLRLGQVVVRTLGLWWRGGGLVVQGLYLEKKRE